MSLQSLVYPGWDSFNADWTLYRQVMSGGRIFLDAYLKFYTSREKKEEFDFRKSISYPTSYAKIELLKIFNSISRRLSEIQRSSPAPPATLDGLTFNKFMADQVLYELGVMGRVGVYVDRDKVEGTTLAESNKKSPYVYIYAVEQIKNWDSLTDTRSVLLCDHYNVYDEKGLVKEHKERYRHVYWEKNKVNVVTETQGEETSKAVLDITKFPFKIFDLRESLLADVAYYQIALLNLESVDNFYDYRLAHPIYIEQRDSFNQDDLTAKKEQKDIEIGPLKGRGYPKGCDAPSFISPDPAASNYKQNRHEQLKNDIRRLLMAAVESLASSSKDSKKVDNDPFEAGLQALGSKLEEAENWIHELWAEYITKEPIKAIYPKDFGPQDPKETLDKAAALGKFVDRIPSKKGKLALLKKIYHTLMANSATEQEIAEVYQEIDKANCLNADDTVVQRDVELGLCTRSTGSIARGYPEGEADKAYQENIDRVTAIAEAQSKQAAADANNPANPNPASRGLKDFSVTPTKDAKIAKTQDGGGRAGTGGK